jgi:hypothetical protein
VAVECPEAAGPEPTPLGDKVVVQAESRRLIISKLGKVLYPQAGFAKGEVIGYYSRIASLLLPHLAGRAVLELHVPQWKFDSNGGGRPRTGWCSTSAPGVKSDRARTSVS